ncbi:MAG: PCC domain-containing protein [bacterium]
MDVQRRDPVAWYRITLSDQEPLKESLLDWASSEGVTFAWLQCLGQVRYADVASGQRKNDVQSQKLMQEMSSNRHVHAKGTLVRSGESEEVHLHGSMGRGRRTTTGCIAKDPSVFYGMEIFVTVLETNE